MLKFDEYIFSLLDDIYEFSLIIQKKVSISNINMDNNEINELYSKRLEKINELLNNKDNDSWENFISENKTKFFDKIADIENIEGVNIKYLENITKHFGDQIKNISKQKSLLIYTK